MGDPQQVEIEKADLSLNLTNAAAHVSTEEVPATQPWCSMDRLWAILWWIAVWPWTIVRRTAVGVWTFTSQAALRTVTGLCNATIWLWTMLGRMAVRMWAGLSSAAVWFWTGLCSFVSRISRWLMIIFMDIFLSAVDLSSDIVNGCLLLNGSEWWENSLSCSFKLIIHSSYRIWNPTLQAF